MKTTLWQKIPGFSQLFINKPPVQSNLSGTAPFVKNTTPRVDVTVTAGIDQPPVFYSQAELASGSTRCPTHLLYPQYPKTWSGIVGKAAAPLYDEISSMVRKVKNRFLPASDTQATSAKEFVGVFPGTTGPSIDTKARLAASAIMASALIMGCGPDSNPLLSALFQTFGGLGLFFVGMNFLSDGMQALSGSTMKKVLSTLTKNKYAAFGIGFGLTGIIQSSSITTTLCVGAVHANMMDLYSALGVTLGSHIGTTVTGWLFATKIAQTYSLPIIGAAAIPYVFSQDEKKKIIGKTAMGLGLIFLGLATMSSGLGSPEIKEPLTSMLQGLHDTSYFGILKGVACGLIVTLGIQSSSSTLAIAMSMAGQGIIPYETAAAAMLGANMGTPITALLASRIPGTKTDARRLAWSHALLHAIGAMLIIYPMSPAFMVWSRGISESMFGDDPVKHVAMFHTLNNTLTATMFLFALGRFMPLIKKIVPDKKPEEVLGGLLLSDALLKNPGLALQASHNVIAEQMNPRVKEMFNNLFRIMTVDKASHAVEQSMRLGENDLDILQADIYGYLNELEQLKLNKSNAVVLDAQRHVTNNIERIGDHLLKLFIQFQEDMPHDFPADALEYIQFIHQEVLNHFLMAGQMVTESRASAWSEIIVQNDIIKKLINEQEKEVAQGSAATQIFYRDVMGLYRNILGNIKNIAEALTGKK